jgi:hypothetical protein
MPRRPDTTTEQLDLFIADLVDVPLRDQRDLMAVPTFALGKQLRIEPIRYERGAGCLHAGCRTFLADRHPARDSNLREARKQTAPAR